MDIVESKLNSTEYSLSGEIGGRFKTLASQNADDKAAVMKALTSANETLQSAVDTVDTVVDGIASNMGSPDSVQETVFKEFVQLNKGAIGQPLAIPKRKNFVSF